MRSSSVKNIKETEPQLLWYVLNRLARNLRYQNKLDSEQEPISTLVE